MQVKSGNKGGSRCCALLVRTCRIAHDDHGRQWRYDEPRSADRGRLSIHGLNVIPEAGPDIFARQRFLVVSQLLDPVLAAFFWSYAHTKFASRLLVGDQQVPMTPSGYGDPAFDGLLEHLRPRVESHPGLRLPPTYSHFRMYKRGDVLERHRDRPACEISVTLNIGQ